MAWLGTGTFAHKPITSPFTFYEDVLPITAAQCGACHAPEGIAPMSLLSHESAVPWGESMRLELVAGHMPPWAAASPPDRFRDRRRLSARELNVLLTWAAGGTPPGDTPKTVEPAPAVAGGRSARRTRRWRCRRWTCPRTSRARRKNGCCRSRRSRADGSAAVDLRPGMRLGRAQRAHDYPSSGRRRRDASERVVGLWVPADQPALLPAGAGWTIEPGAELVVRVSYRKRWDREREPASDQSTLGLYFATPAAAAARPDALA